MHQGKYIFAQIIEFIPRREFDKFVKKYGGNSRVKNLDCRDQLLAMMFGQLANLRSLRGIVLCLNAHSNLLYHLGFKLNNFTLSTLSRANENRNFQIYRDLANVLIERARKLYVNDNEFKIELEGAIYALDSTVIELCFKWIKQHLRIEVFWGYSANAVKTQICIALCAFLLVAIMKKKMDIKRNLYEILQILSVSQFEKTPVNIMLSEIELQNFNEHPLEQPSLFTF